MNKKILYGVLIIVFCLIGVRHAHADPLWYGDLFTTNGDSVTLELRGLEQKEYFTCSIASRDCTPLATPPVTTQPVDASSSPIHFPNGSTRQNTSPMNHFGFFTNLSKGSTTRTLGFVTVKKHITYTIKDSVHFWNLLEEQPKVSSFAPDESSLAYLDDRSGFASLYVTNLGTMSAKNFQGVQITKGVSVGNFRYADSATLLYVANTISDPYNWVLYAYDISSKTSKILAEHLTYDTGLYQSGNSVVVTQLTPLGAMPIIITDFHKNGIDHFTIPKGQPQAHSNITYTYQKIAGINTVIMSNPSSAASEHPVIIWLHGGPYRQASFMRHAYISYGVYDWVLEQAVNQGAYVVKVDYPGSYGAGRTFTESIKYNAGLVDVGAVEKVVSDVMTHNQVSGVYVIGNSYGGYLALRFGVAYPNQVSGVLSINGVTDWGSLLTFYQNSIFNTFFNGLPSSRNKKLFAQASILNRASKFQSPVFLIQGDVDTTIPKAQAILLKNILDQNHKDSSLILIPGENHVFEKDSSINTICNTVFSMIGVNSGGSCDLNG